MTDKEAEKYGFFIDEENKKRREAGWPYHYRGIGCTVSVAPGKELIEKALARGERSVEGWSVWRCRKCESPAAGGLHCPGCGGSFNECCPWT